MPKLNFGNFEKTGEIELTLEGDIAVETPMQTSRTEDYRLPQTLDDIEAYFAEFKSAPEPVVAMDTETTGLDVRTCNLVGISFSVYPGTGMYVPVGHLNHNNFPLLYVIQRLRQGLHDKTAVFWNAKFDLNVIERFTQWVPEKYEDAMELYYLADPSKKLGLKETAKRELGADMEHFEDLFAQYVKSGKNKGKKKKIKKDTVYNIANKSPFDCVSYACSDADFTLRLYYNKRHIKDEFPIPYQVDTQLIEVVRKLEFNGGFLLNKSYIEHQIKRLTTLEQYFQEQVWRMVGYQFDLDSPTQVGTAFYQHLGIECTERTEKGAPSTRAEVLEKLSEDHPVADKLTCYKKVAKAKNTYMKKLAYLAETNRKPYFQFSQYGAPTYRFAAYGGDPDKDGSTGINIQSVSNGKLMRVWGVNVTTHSNPSVFADVPFVIESTLDNDTTYTCVSESCDHCPLRNTVHDCVFEGIDTTRKWINEVQVLPSIRQGFRAPDGFTLASFDYDRQEIVIAANLSQERVWLDAMKAGEDIHAKTAEAVFGVKKGRDNDKIVAQCRRDAKAINFGVLYGMSAASLAKRLNKNLEEGERIYNSYFEKLKNLKIWIDQQQSFAKKHKFITTWWGRRRLLAEDFAKNWGHGLRNASNTPVQGTGAEVTRIAMVRCDKWIKKNNLQNDVIMVYTLHDELGFLIRDTILEDGIRGIKKCMEFEIKGWEQQLSVGCKTGRVWGLQTEVTL